MLSQLKYVIKGLYREVYKRIYKCLWCVDRVSIGILLLLVSISSFELISSLQVIELRMSKNIFLFKKHIFFIVVFFLGILLLSNLSPENNILLCALVGFMALFLCILLFFLGNKINGSKRWINLFFITLQPSVFLKNTIGVFFPFLFKQMNHHLIFLTFCCALVLFQPDFGMCLLLFSVSMTEILLMYEEDWKKYSYLVFIVLAVFALFLFFKGDYFIKRVAKFFSNGGLYQSNIALYNIRNTHLFGNNSGPNIPDAHCDFIMASIISHYGIVTGMFIIFLFTLFFVQNIRQASDFKGKKRIVIYGILAQIAYQSIFHFASNLNVIPPKGVSCPFLSFGGSELLASIFSIGTLLSFTKRKLD